MWIKLYSVTEQPISIEIIFSWILFRTSRILILNQTEELGLATITEALGLATITEVLIKAVEGSHREISLAWEVKSLWKSVWCAARTLSVVKKLQCSHSNGTLRGSYGSKFSKSSFWIFSSSACSSFDNSFEWGKLGFGGQTDDQSLNYPSLVPQEIETFLNSLSGMKYEEHFHF